MKKLIHLLLFATLLAISPHSNSQNTWLAQVGLPDEFAVYENFVVTGKTSYGIREIETVTFVSGKPKYAYTYESYSKPEKFQTCLLNYLENCVNEYGIPLNYANGGDINLYKPTTTGVTPMGPFAGKTYLHGWEERSITPTATGCEITATWYPYMNTEQNGLPAITPWRWIERKTVSTINGKTYTSKSTKKITKADLESRTGLSEEQIAQQFKIVYSAKYQDPSQYITSIFGVVEVQGNTCYNKTLINGQDWHTQIGKGLIQPFGKPLSPMKFSWVVYNGCNSTDTKPAGSQGWGMFHGNFGECYRYMSDPSDPLSDYINITDGSAYSCTEPGNVIVNSSGQYITVEIVPHWTPAPEKNTAESGYYDLKTGQPIFQLK